MTDYFEAIVVGSGFGGTILALSLANKYEADNDRDETDKKVCLLERGQWWLPHEMNFVPRDIAAILGCLKRYIATGRATSCLDATGVQGSMEVKVDPGLDFVPAASC